VGKNTQEVHDLKLQMTAQDLLVWTAAASLSSQKKSAVRARVLYDIAVRAGKEVPDEVVFRAFRATGLTLDEIDVRALLKPSRQGRPRKHARKRAAKGAPLVRLNITRYESEEAREDARRAARKRWRQKQKRKQRK
jgi:hypothetical protein